MSEYIIWESDGIEVQGHRVTQYEKREEIVRCRDCKYAHPEEPSDRRSRKQYQGGYWCGWFQTTMGNFVEPNGFCAWGERKSEGE